MRRAHSPRTATEIISSSARLAQATATTALQLIPSTLRPISSRRSPLIPVLGTTKPSACTTGSPTGSFHAAKWLLPLLSAAAAQTPPPPPPHPPTPPTTEAGDG